MFYCTWIRLSYGFFDQFGYYDRYCCIINMNMFIVIFSYLHKCICIFFVPLIILMRYFVIFVMFSIIKHISYHVIVYDWNKNILSYLILSDTDTLDMCMKKYYFVFFLTNLQLCELLPQFLLEPFDTLPSQYRHTGHVHEEILF